MTVKDKNLLKRPRVGFFEQKENPSKRPRLGFIEQKERVEISILFIAFDQHGPHIERRRNNLGEKTGIIKAFCNPSDNDCESSAAALVEKNRTEEDAALRPEKPIKSLKKPEKPKDVDEIINFILKNQDIGLPDIIFLSEITDEIGKKEKYEWGNKSYNRVAYNSDNDEVKDNRQKMAVYITEQIKRTQNEKTISIRRSSDCESSGYPTSISLIIEHQKKRLAMIEGVHVPNKFKDNPGADEYVAQNTKANFVIGDFNKYFGDNPQKMSEYEKFATKKVSIEEVSDSELEECMMACQFPEEDEVIFWKKGPILKQKRSHKRNLKDSTTMTNDSTTMANDSTTMANDSTTMANDSTTMTFYNTSFIRNAKFKGKETYAQGVNVSQFSNGASNTHYMGFGIDNTDTLDLAEPVYLIPDYLEFPEEYQVFSDHPPMYAKLNVLVREFSDAYTSTHESRVCTTL